MVDYRRLFLMIALIVPLSLVLLYMVHFETRGTSGIFPAGVSAGEQMVDKELGEYL